MFDVGQLSGGEMDFAYIRDPESGPENPLEIREPAFDAGQCLARDLGQFLWRPGVGLAMEVFDAIRNRRAVREFTDQRVDRATVQRLIDAAVKAPSAMNLQPWAFLVVQDRTALHRFSDAAKVHLLSTIIPSSPLANYRTMLTDPAFEIFYGAPTLIVVCTEGSPSTEATHATEDCCLAAENLMLAAHATGLGSCWIGFARPWLATEAAKAALEIPENWVPVAPIIVGHPRQTPPPSPRKAPSVIWYEPRS